MAAALPEDSIVGIVGAGAMGRGIAQVAAGAGHTVLLHDAKEDAAATAKAAVAQDLAKRVDKGRMAAYVAPIPVYVIRAEFATLIGAAAALRAAAKT